MSQEKMKVLSLLEDGVISATEAIELLGALNLDGDIKRKKSCSEKNANSSDFEEKMRDFGKNVEQIAKEIGDKLSDTAKFIEPKIKKTAKIVVEKTVTVLDDMSKSLQDSIQDCGDVSSDEEQAEKVTEEPVEDLNDEVVDDVNKPCCCNTVAESCCDDTVIDDKPIEN